jgi:hypothetical protein
VERVSREWMTEEGEPVKLISSMMAVAKMGEGKGVFEEVGKGELRGGEEGEKGLMGELEEGGSGRGTEAR